MILVQPPNWPSNTFHIKPTIKIPELLTTAGDLRFTFLLVEYCHMLKQSSTTVSTDNS